MIMPSRAAWLFDPMVWSRAPRRERIASCVRALPNDRSALAPRDLERWIRARLAPLAVGAERPVTQRENRLLDRRRSRLGGWCLDTTPFSAQSPEHADPAGDGGCRQVRDVAPSSATGMGGMRSSQSRPGRRLMKIVIGRTPHGVAPRHRDLRLDSRKSGDAIQC
jgi:hypothetical protein